MKNPYLAGVNRVFLQAGVRRSGNHAIMNWLSGMLGGTVICNNGSTRPTHYGEDGNLWRFNRRLRLIGPQEEKVLSPEAVLYSVEDTPTRQIWHKQATLDKIKDRKLDVRRFIVIRDPFNTLASIVSHFHLGTTDYCQYDNGRFGVLWSELARETIELSQGPATIIDYNRWLVSEDYRKIIAKELGLKFSDKGFGVIPNVARGSSFTESKQADDEFRRRALRRFESVLHGDEEDAYRFWVGLNNTTLWRAASKLYTELTCEVLDGISGREKEWEKRWMRPFQ